MELAQQLVVNETRNDFPILQQRINGKPLIYFDNAATTQKPTAVLSALQQYYATTHSNVHRGIHTLSARATEAYEHARKKIACFINASPKEIIFTKGTTEAINIIAHSYAKPRVTKGDTILLTEMEHHSNLVPWQILARATGAHLAFIPITHDGTLDLAAAEELLQQQPRLLAITHASNVLGTINPLKCIITTAHHHDVPVIVDAAQSVPHLPVDVKDLNADFLAFSGHKMLGPTGIGVLYGKKELLEHTEPAFGGGDMIKEVTPTTATWNDPPWKFEPGTPPIAEAIALGEAVTYLERLGMHTIHDHEQELTTHALEHLKKTSDVVLYGPPTGERCGLISFNLADVHPHDLASVLDEEGIAIRSGHLCAMPLMNKLNTAAVARISFAPYNTTEEIDQFLHALTNARRIFKL